MWPVTGTETKYENNWMSVREDAVVRPDGSPGSFGVMTVRHASVFVVALTEDDQVWLVDVDRHTVGRSLEIPSGGSDGQDPLVAPSGNWPRRPVWSPSTGARSARWMP
mgnify:CR=1 FL=1